MVATLRWLPVAIWLSAFLGGGGAGVLRAEPDPNAAAIAAANSEVASADRSVTLEIIEARREQAAAAADLSDESKKKAAEFYRQAAESLKLANDLAAAAAFFKQDAETVQGRVQEIKTQIAELRDKTPELPSSALLPDCERELARQGRILAQAKLAQVSAEAQPSLRANRRRDARTLLVSASQRLQEINQQLEAKPPPDDPPLLTLARRTELLARRTAVEQEVPALENELARFDAEDSVDIVRLRRDLRIQEVAFAERQYQVLDTRIKEIRGEAARVAVRQAHEELVQACPSLRDFAARNQDLATESQSLTRLAQETEIERQKATSQLEEVERQFQQLRERVDSLGLNGAVGALLRRQRGALPDVRKLRQRIRARREVIDDARFKLFELDDERRELAKPDLVVQRILKQVDRSRGDAGGQLELAAENVVQRKREYLDSLIRNYNTYFDTLIALDTIEQHLIQLTEQFSTYVDQRVLWIRSGKPLFAGLAPSETDLWFISGKQWQAVAARLRNDVRDTPAVFVLSAGGGRPLVCGAPPIATSK